MGGKLSYGIKYLAFKCDKDSTDKIAAKIFLEIILKTNSSSLQKIENELRKFTNKSVLVKITQTTIQFFTIQT